MAADRDDPPAARWTRPITGRAGWVVTSQGLSSLSNFAITIVVARAVDPTSFGWFALAYSLYGLTVSIARSAVSQPLSIRFAADPEARGQGIAEAAGAAGLVGAAGGAVTLVTAAVAVLLGGDAAVLVTMALVLPGLMLQDLWRYAFFTLGTPRGAAANDLVWVLVQAVAIAGALRLGSSSAAVLTGAWGLAGAAAAAYGVRQVGCAPRWSAGPRYLRRHRDLGGTFSLVTLIYLGTSYLVMIALGPIVGVAGLGALRGGNALFGPYNILVNGLVAAGPAEARRILAEDPQRLLPVLARVSSGLAAFALAIGVVLVALPDAAGEAVLGETWASASMLVPALLSAALGRAVTMGALVGLRVVEAKADLIRVSVVANGVSTVVALAAGATGGLQPAAWGLSSGVWIAAVVAWRALSDHLSVAVGQHRQRRAGREVPSS